MTDANSTRRDLTGHRFGRWLVTGFARKNSWGMRRWYVRCDCGTESEVASGTLMNGSSKSCGCLNREIVRTHGMSRTPTHNSWRGMFKRCKNASHRSFKNYGAKGITVCERWHKFENFVADMGERPNGLTLDRINLDKGYSPDNCRWADLKQQARNKHKNVIITLLDGSVVSSMPAASEATGLSESVLWARYRKGDTGERLFRPVRHKRPNGYSTA